MNRVLMALALRGSTLYSDPSAEGIDQHDHAHQGHGLIADRIAVFSWVACSL